MVWLRQTSNTPVDLDMKMAAEGLTREPLFPIFRRVISAPNGHQRIWIRCVRSAREKVHILLSLGFLIPSLPSLSLFAFAKLHHSESWLFSTTDPSFGHLVLVSQGGGGTFGGGSASPLDVERNLRLSFFVLFCFHGLLFSFHVSRQQNPRSICRLERRWQARGKLEVRHAVLLLTCR
jgi:hypothetical protein